MIHVDFSVVWPMIKDIAINKARMAMNYEDAEDLVSEYSVEVWSHSSSSGTRFKCVEHAKAYYLRMFKMRTIDFLRKRKRLNLMMENYRAITPNTINSGVIAHMTMGDIISNAESISKKHVVCATMVVEGYTYREISEKIGVAFVTVGRMFKDVMTQTLDDERVSSVNDSVSCQKNKMGGLVMASKFTCKKVGKAVKVIKDKVVVAIATLSNDEKSIGAVEVRKGCGVNASSVIPVVYSFLGIEPPSTVRQNGEEEDMAKAKKQKEENTAKEKATAKAKKKSEGSVPAARPMKDPVNLDNIKDFPSSLDAWRKKVGGEGYCLGGSGSPVGSRFKPGYDAKLKSALKRIGSDNAKNIAKELGWLDMIKWNK